MTSSAAFPGSPDGAAAGSLPVPAGGAAARPFPRRRDRRGRGPRGPLLPPGLPASRTRADRFDDLVLGTVERLETRWGAQLEGTEFAVEDVPPSDPAPWEESVPLGRCFPAESGQPARVVVYRRPVEARAIDDDDLADLVRDVVVEQVAQLLARTPEEIDPGYDAD
ncbi:hypothetical protein GCM10023221_14120 [Luteimicrobium xylanilyticum]|uniref:Uncharacterized protein n=1 Tax=Luteimicrobium xylanilyticum TaxID=1133546 RepID=A0A5P9QD02_9MICO|nr:metallopeptidase family protein [Luteimicrobium xylanilyticum]QFU99116.1 hypothetical protein KDY119_02642 [Luteimicrobium xylanilyticum]